MGHRPRPDLPGVAFHLTARLQGRLHLLTPGVRNRCVDVLRRRVLSCDTRLLAYAIMTNHLHLVVVQGNLPLGRFMQPFLRSIAWAVQKTHGVEGHVFEGPFRDRICRDADHLRNAIAYTHANPVRAGLCEKPDEYHWSSHRFYSRDARRSHRVPPLDVRRGLEPFAPRESDWRSTGRSAYVSFLSGIIPPRTDAANSRSPVRDEAAADPNGLEHAEVLTHPRRLGDATPSVQSTPPKRGRRQPIEEIAREILEQENIDRPASLEPVTLEAVRSRWGPRRKLAARVKIARAAVGVGYSRKQVGVFLDVSESTVSRMLASER